MSGNNPFRKQAPSEQEVTVAPPRSPPPSGVLQRPPSPPLPAVPQRTASPHLPIPMSDPPPQSSSSHHGIPPDASFNPTITENIDFDDLPPPYTPAANVGEATVGLGPRRPFQPPPPIPPTPRHPPPNSHYHSNWTPPSAQSRWPPPTDRGWNSGFRVQPEPRLGLAPWQNQQQYRQRQNAGGGLLGMLFETVRDIAESVSGAHDERLRGSLKANAGAYATPYSSTGTVYAPPTVPPPPPPPRPASAPPHSPPPMVPDDGSPTRTPVPGHPLLRGGSLLVYPKDHLCVKCKNTGYENYDPSHSCRKCWEKYGKPYTGALTYMSWSPSGNDPRMQRPLPKFLPPHLASPSSESHAGPAHASEPRFGPPPPPPQGCQQLQHSRSRSQPHSLHSPGSGPSYYVVDPSSRDAAILPVPHAIAVSPGDPRMGGRLCMRCGGAGKRMVMLLDLITCEDCGGTGRVWM